MVLEALPPDLLTRFISAIELFTSRAENQGESTTEQDIAAKNVITGPGSTLDRKKSPPSGLSGVERERVKAIGAILAKEFYNYNQSRKADVKQKTKVSGPGGRETGFGILGRGLKEKGKEAGPSTSSLLGGLLSGITDTVNTITDTVSTVGDLLDFGKDKKAKKAGKGRARASRTKAPRTRAPRAPKGKGGFFRNILKKKPGVPKVPGRAGIVGRTLSRIPKLGRLIPGGLKVASEAATAAEGAATILPKATSVLSAGGRAVGAVGSAAKFAGKAIPLAAIGIDAGTAAYKLFSEKGREDLKASVEEHNIFENPLKVLSNALFNPLQTIAGITLQVGDMFDSMKRAKESEEALKVAEEKSRQKFIERMEKFDTDKTGKLDTAERLKMYREKKQAGIVEDESGKKWRYSAKEDKIISTDGNISLSVEEFLKKSNIAPPPPVAPTPQKPAEVPPALPTAIANQPIATPIPTQPKPAPIPPISVKPELNLDSQNSLINMQNNILVSLLEVSKQHLVLDKNKPAGGPGGTTVIPMVNNTGSENRHISTSIDPRSLFTSSPYSLSPT